MSDTGPAEGFLGVKNEKYNGTGPGTGEQYHYKFPNGYGASVIRGEYTYGGPQGKWELAVLGQDGHLCYTTPGTADVAGHLEPHDVARLLGEIRDLPVPGLPLLTQES